MTDNLPPPPSGDGQRLAQLFHLAYDRLRTRIYGQARPPPRSLQPAAQHRPRRVAGRRPRRAGRHDETEHGLSDRQPGQTRLCRGRTRSRRRASETGCAYRTGQSRGRHPCPSKPRGRGRIGDNAGRNGNDAASHDDASAGRSAPLMQRRTNRPTSNPRHPMPRRGGR